MADSVYLFLLPVNHIQETRHWCSCLQRVLHRISLYFGETREQESNMNCSIPVSQLSLSTGNSLPAKRPKWYDSVGWIHVQWQWNFKGLQHIFPLFLNSQIFSYDHCSEQYRNLCFSSVVEERQAKTKRLWDTLWLATRSERLCKWSECKASVLLLGLISLVT